MTTKARDQAAMSRLRPTPGGRLAGAADTTAAPAPGGRETRGFPSVRENNREKYFFWAVTLIAGNPPGQPRGPSPVGWVERSETHRRRQMNFAPLDASYAATCTAHGDLLQMK